MNCFLKTQVSCESLGIKSKIGASMGFPDVPASRRVPLNCDSSKINDGYHSVRSIDGPISTSSLRYDNYSPKSIDGAITKTLTVHGIGSATNSISIKTVTALPKSNGQNKNCSGKVKSSNTKEPNIGVAAMKSNQNKELPTPFSTDGNQKGKLGSNLSANKLCVGKSISEMKRLIDCVGQSIKSSKSDVPNQILMLHEKMKKFKLQMDHCKNKERDPAHLVEQKEPHQSDHGHWSPTKPKSERRKKTIKAPHINLNFHLNLSSGRSGSNKKSVPNSTQNSCKCNSLKNSNRCLQYDAIPSNRMANVCFCHCAYTTRGTDGVTYHTMCQCSEPSTLIS